MLAHATCMPSPHSSQNKSELLRLQLRVAVLGTVGDPENNYFCENCASGSVSGSVRLTVSGNSECERKCEGECEREFGV